MTIKPHQSAGTLTQELLNHLRHRLKVLVQDYELFLLSHNGGTLVPELMFPIPNSDDDGFRFSEFFPSIVPRALRALTFKLRNGRWILARVLCPSARMV
jgi:hypothetical protein